MPLSLRSRGLTGLVELPKGGERELRKKLAQNKEMNQEQNDSENQNSDKEQNDSENRNTDNSENQNSDKEQNNFENQNSDKQNKEQDEIPQDIQTEGSTQGHNDSEDSLSEDRETPEKTDVTIINKQTNETELENNNILDANKDKQQEKNNKKDQHTTETDENTSKTDKTNNIEKSKNDSTLPSIKLHITTDDTIGSGIFVPKREQYSQYINNEGVDYPSEEEQLEALKLIQERRREVAEQILSKGVRPRGAQFNSTPLPNSSKPQILTSEKLKNPLIKKLTFGNNTIYYTPDQTAEDLVNSINSCKNSAGISDNNYQPKYTGTTKKNTNTSIPDPPEEIPKEGPSTKDQSAEFAKNKEEPHKSTQQEDSYSRQYTTFAASKDKNTYGSTPKPTYQRKSDKPKEFQYFAPAPNFEETTEEYPPEYHRKYSFVQEDDQNSPIMNSHTVRLTDAVACVPTFSGTSEHSTFREFSTGCMDALEMLPRGLENNLVKMIKSKLLEGAKISVRGKNFETVQSLLNYLQKSFLPEDVSTLQGELKRVRQLYNEGVSSFASRIKDVGYAMIDAYRAENDGECSERRLREFNKEMLRTFIVGLRQEISVVVQAKTDLDDAIREATRYERILKDQSNIKISKPKEIETNERSLFCKICKKTNHKTENCRLIKTLETQKVTSVAVKCQTCDQEGHTSKECKTCAHCKKRGHKMEDCFSYKNLTTPCQLCHKTGHRAEKCFLNKTPKESCQLCNKTGHTAKNCNTRKNEAPRCYNCQKTGHMAAECRERRNAWDSPRCFTCQKPGHIAAECRERRNMRCQLCYLTGHLARNCQSNQGNLKALPPVPTPGEEAKPQVLPVPLESQK